MIGKASTDKRVVSLPETLDILEERKKGGELGYEQELAYEHAKKFSAISIEKAKKLKGELTDLGLSEKTAVKVVDVMPINEAQLRNVLIIEKKTVEEEMVKKILELVNQYRNK